MCAGPAATDLGLAFSDFEGEAREAFFDANGEVDSDVETMARARAIMTAARVFVWAADVGELWLSEHSTAALGHGTRGALESYFE